MEKLIELLNEYEYDKRREKALRGMTNGCLYYIQSINSYLNLKIISKEYGFIKWLVDNDKIDKKKFEDEFFACGCCGYKLLSTRETCEACGDEVLDIYEALLMRLAIQDEPIEFLISILK